MSKKSTRRKMRKETPQTVLSPSSPGRTAAPASTVQSYTSKTFEFKPDYSYVIKDLRRIGTLAGTFIVILVALSFFLR
jgi:hypothetical protein